MTCDLASIPEVMRLLYNRGLISILGGNASIRCGDKVFITPSGVPKINIRSLSVINIKGERIAGPTPSIEYRFHLAIYKKTSAGAVLHAHPPNVVALARLGIRPSLDDFVESMAYVKGYKYVKFYPPGSVELANAIEEAAGDDVNLLVLERHGVVSWGKDLYEALNAMEAFEDLAKIYLLSLARGLSAPQSRS